MKAVKMDFIQKPLQNSKRDLSIELGSVPNTDKHGHVRIYSHGAGSRSMDGKLLRGNNRGREGFWLNRPNRILTEGRLGQ